MGDGRNLITGLECRMRRYMSWTVDTRDKPGHQLTVHQGVIQKQFGRTTCCAVQVIASHDTQLDWGEVDMTGVELLEVPS